MDFRITEIDRTTVEVPFADEAAAHLQRELPLWGIFEILRVRTNVGPVGVGETMLHYSRSVQDRAIEDAVGKDPHDLLYAAGIGDGLEMAVWDLAAQYAGVPIHALLGAQVRDEVPIAWWCIDMRPEDWASQAQRAIATGYTDMKLKGRPWWGIIEQVQAVCDVLPSNVKIDVDFNGFLLDSEGALPVLRELEEHPHVVLFETPIHQHDVAGNVRLRSQITSQIAHHFGDPDIPTVVREGVCDGFVIGGPVQAALAQGHTAAALDMPFWLQIVGTGITTTWATHLGAVLTHATWPAITCLNIYENQMIREPLQVRHGHTPVSDRPGLGIDLDDDAIARYEVQSPVTKTPPRLLHRISFDDCPTVYYKDAGYQIDFYERRLPTAHRGVRLETLHDDGSAEFSHRFAQAD